jgi:hypothetical protein
MSIQNLDHEHTGEKYFNLEDIYNLPSKDINFHDLLFIRTKASSIYISSYLYVNFFVYYCLLVYYKLCSF